MLPALSINITGTGQPCQHCETRINVDNSGMKHHKNAKIGAKLFKNKGANLWFKGGPHKKKIRLLSQIFGKNLLYMFIQHFNRNIINICIRVQLDN